MSASADLGARGMNWSQRLHGASDLSGGSASTAMTPVTIKEHSFWKLDSRRITGESEPRSAAQGDFTQTRSES